MMNKFIRIWLICISSVILAFLIMPNVLAASSFNVVDVFLSKKDCTAPPSPDANLFTCATKATSFKVGEQVWHCIKSKNVEGGGVAVTHNFYVDGALKKSNSVPGYPNFYQTRCDYYKTYTNSDVGTHTFNGEVFPCAGGVCSKSISFEIKAAPQPPQPKFTITNVYMKDTNENKKTIFSKGDKIKGCAIIKNIGDGDGVVTLNNYFFPNEQLLNTALNNLAPNNIMEQCSNLPLINAKGTYGYKAKITPCSAPQKCAKSVHFKIS